MKLRIPNTWVSSDGNYTMDMVCKTLKLSKPVKTDILTTKYVFKKYSSLHQEKGKSTLRT